MAASDKIRLFSLISTALDLASSISSSNAHGSTTTPFPIIEILFFLTIPDGITYKLRLLPSGIVRKNKISIIGNGVVVDPWALLDEIKEIKSKGVDVDEKNLILSESANLILPFHKEMD